MGKEFSVYILTNKGNRVFYVGVTSDLIKRVSQHKEHIIKGSFTDRYNIDKLVYYEYGYDSENAILREKQIKRLLRWKKIKLIKSQNANFDDLYNKLI